MGLKLLSEEASLSTASTFNSAVQVRVYATGAAVITIYDTDGITVLGSCTVPSGAIAYFEKKPTEYIGANVAVLASSVAYTHLD